MMLVISKEDADAPRALSICVPITTSSRGSAYEVELPKRPFFSKSSFANVQGIQAIQHHEMIGPVGLIYGGPFEQVKEALRRALEL